MYPMRNALLITDHWSRTTDHGTTDYGQMRIGDLAWRGSRKQIAWRLESKRGSRVRRTGSQAKLIETLCPYHGRGLDAL
jgi:hypothetical protein